MRTFNVQQGTHEWLMCRVGRITSTGIAAVVTKPKLTKKGVPRAGVTELADRRKYRAELVAERLTGNPAWHPVTPPMQWGIDNERFARAAYEVGLDVMVDTVGFVLHPSLDFLGASPDGLVGNRGGIEAKCPTTETFLEWLDADAVPEEHIPQMDLVISCCELDWLDFVAFDPRLPIGLRFFMKRLMREEKRIAEMEYEAIHFNDEIEKKRLRLSPGHIWAPPMPRLPSEEMVSIGDLSIPKDLSDVLDRAELIP